MTLESKYKSLSEVASTVGIKDLQVRSQDNVLYIDGTAPNAGAKDQMWDAYDKIDPNFSSGDLVMNINVAHDASVTLVKVITESSNLNIRKGPGTNQPIVGKAAHGEVISLINKSSEEWYLVRTKDGEEGYAYARYLQDVS